MFLIFNKLISGEVMQKLFITLLLLLGFITTGLTQTLERKDVADKYKWNLADLYPTVEAWQADVDKLNKEVEKLADFKGTLGESS